MALPVGVYDRILTPDLYPDAQLWDRHYFYGGRNIQGAELNEIESLLSNKVAGLGRTLYSEGSVISGCDFVVKPIPVSVTISEADVVGAGLAITGTSPTLASIDQWNQYYRYAAFQKGYLTSLSDSRLDYRYSNPSVGAQIVSVSQYFTDRSTQTISVAESVNVTINNGTLFLAGQVRQVPGSETPVSLKGFGLETIGIIITETVITPDTDPTLLDPALAPTVGATQFNLKGALRSVLSYSWVANDVNAIQVFEFLDGNWTGNVGSGNLSSFEGSLARTTYDQLGNFVVQGVTPRVRVSQTDASKLVLTVDTGRAYVQGRSIVKNTASTFVIDKAIDTSSISSEPHLVTDALIYKLFQTPVAGITSVDGQVQRNNVPVTKGVHNGSDNLLTQGIAALSGIQSVVTIQTVGDTPGATDYTEGVDYTVSGNSIVWVGAQPSVGATYYINLIFIKSLVAAQKSLTKVLNEGVVRGAANTSDSLTKTNGITVIVVANGTDPTDPDYRTYAYGVDWLFVSGRTPTTSSNHIEIDWSPASGNQPAPGATYYVSYTYWRDTSVGVPDYVSVASYIDPSYTDPAQQSFQGIAALRFYCDIGPDLDLAESLDFRTSSGDTPVLNTSLIVNYNFYLPRRDSISLKSDGEIVIYRGISAINPVFPEIPVRELPLGYLSIPGFSFYCAVILPENRRLTTQDQWLVKDSADSGTYNEALTIAETRALIVDTPTPKLALLVDPFVDFSRCLPLHDNGAMSLWPEGGSVGLPQILGAKQLVPDAGNSINVKIHKNITTLSYTEIIAFSQTLRSDLQTPNAQSLFDPLVLIKITPDRDFWMDPQNVDLNQSQRYDELIPEEFTFLNTQGASNQQLVQTDLLRFNTLARIRNSISRFWSGAGGIVPWGGSLEIGSLAPGFDVGNLGVGVDPSQSLTYDPSAIVSSKALERIDHKLVDRSVIPFCRLKTITVESVAWPPDVDSIQFTIDEIPVMVTPSVGTTAGTVAGSLKSDSNGHFKGTFILPSGMRVGRREVVAQAAYPQASTAVLVASAIYAAEGVRTVDYTNFTIPGVLGTIEKTWSADPIGQILSPGNSAALTSINLYLKTKPASTNHPPLIVQIRDIPISGSPVSAGSSINFPTRNILGEGRVAVSDIVVSDDGSVATHVTFDDPVFLEAGQLYYLAILTDNNEYSFHAAKEGQIDPASGKTITVPAQFGPFVGSVNGVTWSVDFQTFLKLDVYAAKFNPSNVASFEGTLMFEPIETVSNSATVELVNHTRSDGTNQSGDSFTVTVQGAANTDVYVIENGAPKFKFGTTDASGTWSVSGVWDDTSIGSYTQTWFVGTVQCEPVINFSVVASGGPPSSGTVTLVDETAPPTIDDLGTHYHVGDAHHYELHGDVAAQVSYKRNNQAPVVVGVTDGSGNLVTPTMTWSLTDVGDYLEVWYIGTVTVGVIQYKVDSALNKGLVSLTDLSRSVPSNQYQSGDSFALIIKGAGPNLPVSVIQNGGAKFTWGELTDANGNWSFSGTWSDADIGSYTQQWFVGNVALAPVINFTVLGTRVVGAVSLTDTTVADRFQVGDDITLSITGAAPNAPVVVSENGGAPFTWGSPTDGGGNWSFSGQLQPTDVGVHVQQWSVGGVPCNPAAISFVVTMGQ